MRTTIDLPDDLLRYAKAKAALKGVTLKELVADALRVALFGQPAGSERSQDQTAPPERLDLGGGCVFPLITGPCGPALGDLSPEAVSRLLEEEEVERALRAG